MQDAWRIRTQLNDSIPIQNLKQRLKAFERKRSLDAPEPSEMTMQLWIYGIILWFTMLKTLLKLVDLLGRSGEFTGTDVIFEDENSV